MEKLLFSLLEQVPENMVTTYSALARALGSRYATRYVASVLKNHPKVVAPCDAKNVFEDFRVERRPLEVLRNVQRILSRRLEICECGKDMRVVGAVDLSFRKSFAVIAYVEGDVEFNVRRIVVAKCKVLFPYIPSFLCFREGPAIVSLLSSIPLPDVLLVNGHGIAHPVSLGLASFVGVALNCASIGVARRLLYGRVEGEKILGRDGKLLGFKVGDLYVSPGNKITPEEARNVVKALKREKGLPFPLNLADRISKIAFRKF
jgi:deoxyribonuclease V